MSTHHTTYIACDACGSNNSIEVCIGGRAGEEWAREEAKQKGWAVKVSDPAFPRRKVDLCPRCAGDLARHR